MLDFQNICKQYRIAYIGEGHHHCHSGWIQIHCPFCASGESGWHLGFGLKHGNFNCWRCGKKKAWDILIAVFPKRSPSDIMKIVNDNQITKTGIPKKKKLRRKTIEKPPRMEAMSSAHKKYLKKENYDPDELEKIWNLQGTKHLSGNWSHRIIIPFYDLDENVIAYQGRILSKHGKPKYKMTENDKLPVEPDSIIYGLHKVPGDSIIIVEGCSDVWRMGPGAVATCGIDWKISQANQLRKYKNRFIMFDPENVAQKQAEKLAKWLSFYSGHTEIIDGLSCDPGDLPQKEADDITQELLF